MCHTYLLRKNDPTKVTMSHYLQLLHYDLLEAEYRLDSNMSIPCVSEVKIRKKWTNNKTQQKPHEDILQGLGNDRRSLCWPSWSYKRGADRRHVKLHSCGSTVKLVKLYRAESPPAAAATGRARAHEPKDPSSGVSAGGDITSSLIDASMA